MADPGVEIPEDANLEQLEALQSSIAAVISNKYGDKAAIAVLERLLGKFQQETAVPAARGRSVSFVGLPRSDSGWSETEASEAASEASGAATDDSNSSGLSARARWARAVALSQLAADPWAARGIAKLPLELARRHRYNPSSQSWVMDTVFVKMEGKPFAAGAMRECYAMKKLSNFSSSVARNWKRAPNFVAKRYKKEVSDEVYFTDVALQMDAKHLGDEYNRTEPPKKVDFMQAVVLEFTERQSAPLFGVEHMIEGDYVKYNSNSGYVAAGAVAAAAAAAAGPGSQPPGVSGLAAAAELLRNTPQAFSHFTFVHTKGQALCVDIQGVGDLYTDPQIHTLDGQGYGDGNLGLRGFALFFRTHTCNALCARLGLQPFERCAPDVAAQGYASSSSSSTWGSGTRTRSFLRHASMRQKLAHLRLSALKQRPSVNVQEVLTSLQAVPLAPSPPALVHWELARLYAEGVLLPELRPGEDPDDARQGGLFHLLHSAAAGCTLAMATLARAHHGLEPSSMQLAHLIKEATAGHEFVADPRLCWRYSCLAAERGVRAAAAAVAHTYATGEGVGEGVLEEPDPAAALKWLRRALQLGADGAALEEEGSDAEDDIVAADGSVRARGRASIANGVQLRIKSGVGMGSDTRCWQACLLDVGQLAEEEAQALPGGSATRWELLAQLGELLLAEPPGCPPNPAEAADAFTEAAEAATAAGKGRLAARYFERAAEASAALED